MISLAQFATKSNIEITTVNSLGHVSQIEMISPQNMSVALRTNVRHYVVVVSSRV